MIVRQKEISLDTIELLIRGNAQKYSISYKEFRDTLWCESHFGNIQSRIVSKTGPNGREDSWGIAQIHLPDHLDVTKEMALDISFAIEWSAKQFAAGREEMWTCYVNSKSDRI